METLTPRELSQTTETRLPATTGRVTIPDPSDTLDDPVVEQTVRKLIETAGRLVANRNALGSGVTAPYETIDDTGRVQLSQEMMTRTGVSDTALPTTRSFGHGFASLLQSIHSEPSSNSAATATWDITSDTG